jgi:hypothetical protein
MSIDYEHAPCCKGNNCTTLLTHRVDIKNGYCYWCWEDKKKDDAEAAKEYKAEQEYNARKAGDYDR